MTELAAGRPPAKDSPELAIRSLLSAMLRLDRAEAARFAPPGPTWSCCSRARRGSVSLPASSMPRSSKCRWSRSNRVKFPHPDTDGQGRGGHAGCRSQGARRTVRSRGNPLRRHPRRIRVACRRGTVLQSDDALAISVASDTCQLATSAWAHPIDLDARVGGSELVRARDEHPDVEVPPPGIPAPGSLIGPARPGSGCETQQCRSRLPRHGTRPRCPERSTGLVPDSQDSAVTAATRA